ncbi:MAG: CPBP family intramembrane metalloprotease [Anaerolineae bacterium]|nr:CPBP family intramembrane metalloprotease [Anaerolineae bacterium]
MHVLVISNKAFNLKNILSPLRQDGYHILAAQNVRDAWPLAEKQLIDLILFDTATSDPGDYDICHSLESRFKAEIIPLPSNSGSGNQGSALALGIDHRVMAALQSRELLAQVRTALQQRHRQSRHTDPPSPVRSTVPHSALRGRRPAKSAVENSIWEHSPNPANPSEPGAISPVGNAWSWLGSSFALNLLVKLHPMVAAWLYLVILATAEACTFLIEPRLGLILHGLVLILLMVNAVLRWEQPVRSLLLSLIFIPLIRILSLSLPLVNLPILYWYLIIAIPLLTATFMIAHTLRLGWSEMGLNLQGLPVQVLIAPLGLAFGYLGYQILKPAPLVSHLTFPQILEPALILFVSTAFTEELIFRGVMQRASIRTMGSAGIIYIAALYTNLHLGHRSPLYVLFVFGLALFFGWTAHKTRSLLGVTLCHGLANIVLFLILPSFS